MVGMKMTLTPRVPLLLLAALFALPAGCAAADASSDDGNVAETRQALTAPSLVATPSPVDFGRVRVGGTRQINVTITNRSGAPAINIIPPDPYYPPDPYVPPDPYYPPDPFAVAHNPPTYLGAYGSGVMTLSFTPRAAGSTSSAIAIRYHDAAGTEYTLRVPVQGSAY